MQNSEVQILLSTYNGELYVAEQLDSLLGQTYKNVSIKIRDDGSSDGTRKILSKYSSNNTNIKVTEGVNLGVVGSFFDLLYNVGQEVDFVAFCDQDDVWNENKIEVAVRQLRKFKTSDPVMYFSATRLVDKELNFIGKSRAPNREFGLRNSLIENVATGCTIVLNRKAIDLLINKRPDLDSILVHDYWVYLVVSCFGQVVYDFTPYINYRQHEANVIGSSKGVRFWVNRFKRLAHKNNKSLSGQAREFYRLYGSQLTEEQRMLVLGFLKAACSESFFKRMFYSIKFPLYRQSIIDSFFSKVMLVFGRYK